MPGAMGNDYAPPTTTFTERQRQQEQQSRKNSGLPPGVNPLTKAQYEALGRYLQGQPGYQAPPPQAVSMNDLMSLYAKDKGIDPKMLDPNQGKGQSLVDRGINAVTGIFGGGESVGDVWKKRSNELRSQLTGTLGATLKDYEQQGGMSAAQASAKLSDVLKQQIKGQTPGKPSPQADASLLAAGGVKVPTKSGTQASSSSSSSSNPAIPSQILDMTMRAQQTAQAEADIYAQRFNAAKAGGQLSQDEIVLGQNHLDDLLEYANRIPGQYLQSYVKQAYNIDRSEVAMQKFYSTLDTSTAGTSSPFAAAAGTGTAPAGG